jgi:hypothetical protein
MKLTSLDAVLNAKRKGQTGPEFHKQAAKDIGNQLLGPVEGPLIRFGKTMMGGNEFAPQAAKDESQPWLNFKTAVQEVNPLVALLSGRGRGAQSVVGPYATTTTSGKTTMEQWASKRLAEQTPKGQQTREEIQTSQLHAKLRDAAKQGDYAPIREAVVDGTVLPVKAKELLKEAKLPRAVSYVTRLSDIGDKLHAWDIASPSERNEIRGEMIRALRAYGKSHPHGQFNSLAAQYRKAGILK